MDVIQALQECLEEIGNDDALDEYVIDAAAMHASSVNNHGIDEQVEFLRAQWGDVELIRILSEAVQIASENAVYELSIKETE